MNLPIFFSSLVAIILMIIGVSGIFFPFVPSTPMIWFGIFLYGVLTGFEKINQDFILTISALALAVVMLDWISTSWNMKKFQASPWSILGAVIGGLLGGLFGPLGLWVFGPILGGLAFGMLVGRDNIYAVKAGRITVIAFLGGTVVKLVLGLLMIGLFLFKIFSSR